jgi:thioredoxin-related protein
MLAAAAVLAALPALTADPWTEDFEAAKKTAAKEDKHLLIDFTGSDWDGRCKRLNEEVFKTDEFTEKAPQDFVLVKLDFPKQKQQSAEIKKQNKKLQEEYQVQGLPTIFLALADGTPYARTGYQEGGPEKYLEHLDELQAQADKLEELQANVKQAEGTGKAKALHARVQWKQESGLPVAPDVGAKILALDPENETGLTGRYESAELLKTAMETLQQHAQQGNMAQALKDLNEALTSEKLVGEHKQVLLAMKAQLFMYQQNMPKALETLEKAHAAAPESNLATRLEMGIQQLKQQAKQAAPDKAAPVPEKAAPTP